MTQEPEPLPKAHRIRLRSLPAANLTATCKFRPRPQVVIDFDDNRAASALVGPYGQNLALVERRLGVVVDSAATTSPSPARATAATPRGACWRRSMRRPCRDTTCRRAKSKARSASCSRRARCSSSIAKTAKASFETINLRKRPVRARTAAQDSYIRALKRHEMVFGVGPAGTGKTWLAVAHAAQLFERKEVDRIILSRPAVEAGERLGFLPGDLAGKGRSLPAGRSTTRCTI